MIDMRTTTLLTALMLTAGAPVVLAQQTTPGAPIQPAKAVQPAGDQDGQHSPDAVAVLNAVSEALKGGFSATMRSYFEGQSSMGSIFPTSEGTWSQKEMTEDGAWAARYVGIGTPPMSQEQLDFDLVWLPDRVTWIDNEEKVLYARPLRGGRKAGKSFVLGNNCWDRVESLADGFAQTLESAAAIDIHEPAEVEGVPCDVVAITNKAGGDPIIWYFGRDDHLPRRCDLVLPDTPIVSGAMRVDFTDPVAGPVDESTFVLSTPDGYTEDISRVLGGAGPQTGNQPGAEPITRRLGAQPTPAMPEWEVMDTDGVAVSPSSLRGKVAVLYFWGTWSAPSKKATPEVASLAKDYQGKPVEVISMAFREGDASKVTDAAAAQGQTWRQVPAADDAAKILSVRLAPAVVVLGKEGELLYKSGRPTADYSEMFTKIRAIIDQALLAQPSGAADTRERPAQAEGQSAGAPAVTPAKRPAKVIRKDD